VYSQTAYTLHTVLHTASNVYAVWLYTRLGAFRLLSARWRPLKLTKTNIRTQKLRLEQKIYFAYPKGLWTGWATAISNELISEETSGSWQEK